MTNDFLARSLDQMVAGVYQRGALLHRSADCAVYETKFGDEALPAAIKIRRGDMADAERVVTRWRNAIKLAHPNLLRVYAAGSSMLDDVSIIYVVMERADESLAGVLAERPLSETETREMVAPALAALRYLHKNGYAHSNLKPSNVLAVGDLLKLSCDSATRTEDGGEPAEDMWELGAVVVQALTQAPPKMEEGGGPYILRKASEPLADIVRHCLDPDPDTRWTADQAAARLDGRVISVPPPVPYQPREDAPRASVSPVAQFRVGAGRRAADGESRRTPSWIFGALAALVLIVVLVGLWRKEYSSPAAITPPPPVASESGPALTPPGPEAITPEANVPETQAPSPAAAPKAPAGVNPAASSAAARRQEGWSVIVAAYNSPEPAEKRQQEMARKWSKFQLSVLHQENAGKNFYLVLIGQNLSEDEADALRKRAIAAGLPRDTYIKKTQ
jgi:hypothetical protein